MLGRLILTSPFEATRSLLLKAMTSPSPSLGLGDEARDPPARAPTTERRVVPRLGISGGRRCAWPRPPPGSAGTKHLLRPTWMEVTCSNHQTSRGVQAYGELTSAMAHSVGADRIRRGTSTLDDSSRSLLGSGSAPQTAGPLRAIITRVAGGTVVETLVIDERLMRAEAGVLEALARVENGKRDEAICVVEASVREIDAFPGPDNAQAIFCLLTLGDLALEFDLPGTAERLFMRALNAERAAFGPTDPRLVTVMLKVGQSRGADGKLNEAEQILREASVLAERAHGLAHPDTVKSLHTLALTMQDMNRLAASIAELRRALAGAVAVYGEEAAEAAEVADALAALLIQNGEADEALRVARSSLAILEKEYGPDHLSVAASLDTLALACKRNGKLDEAEACQRRSVAIFEQGGKAPHPAFGRALGNLAGTLIERGNVEGGVRLLERALAVKEAALGPMHPSVAHTLHNLACWAADRGDFETAQPLARRAHEVRMKSWGLSHPETEQSRELYARISKDLAGARPFLEAVRQAKELEADFLSRRSRFAR